MNGATTAPPHVKMVGLLTSMPASSNTEVGKKAESTRDCVIVGHAVNLVSTHECINCECNGSLSVWIKNTCTLIVWPHEHVYLIMKIAPCLIPSLSLRVFVSGLMKFVNGMLVVPRMWPL